MKCPKCQSENPDTVHFCADCGTQLLPSKKIPFTETLETPTEELTRGATFASRYEIIEELGKGGMGKVYRVEDKKIKEEIALKLIKPEIAADKKTIERFSNELKMARMISHRNVCRMFDLGEEKGTHYITMEYVHGDDLKGMIRMMGQLSAGQAISITKQVCEGLSEAHRLGVVHRDLKPQNIMIDKEGNVRIMDFGIARSLKAKGITGAGVMIGTPEYMSPEQVEGKEVDQRSDIYSLGVILYEMVTGRVPFEGDTPFTIGVKHKSEMPKDPKELNAQVPSDFSRVIMRCLEKDKENRCQSAGEVRSELENIEKGIPTTERIVPKRKPITSREITVTFGLKKLFIPALVVAVLVIAGVVIWQLLPKKEAIPLAPSDKPSLVVMYFKNNTGDENLDIWRSALSDSLITDLSQSKYIRVLSRDKLLSILKQMNILEAEDYSLEDLKQVAERGGVNHILQGTYNKAGDTFRIDITLQETSTMELIGSERVEGKGEESIFPMVDELTRRIKADFRLSEKEIASDIDKQIGQITTSSPEAYKYYIEARIHHDKGDNRKAITFYKKAVEIDPEFATAYRSMGIAYGNLGYGAESRKYRQKAFELSDRVSDRERYRNEAEFYITRSETYDKAIEAYKKLFELYPDDLGRNNLALIYSNLEQWDKAIEQFEMLIQRKEETYYPYVNIADVYVNKGLYDRANQILKYYLNNFPDHVQIHAMLAYNYICQGKYDLALEEVSKTLSLDPMHIDASRMKGNIYLYRENLIEAEKEFQMLLESEEPIAKVWGIVELAGLYILKGKFEKSIDLVKQGIEQAKKAGQKGWERNYRNNFLTYLYLRSGNHEAALEECNKVLSISIELGSLGGQRSGLYRKGLAYIRMKSMDKAHETAEELKELIEEGLNKKLMRNYYHLMGMIELERQNFSKAIEYFKKALSLLPYNQASSHALFIDPLALAYYKAGNLEKAREEYKRISSLTVGRLFYGDIYANSFYMLGKIYEQKGYKAKAIEHYEKFLDLWKDADPGLPQVEDAKKRLAGLKE